MNSKSVSPMLGVKLGAFYFILTCTSRLSARPNPSSKAGTDRGAHNGVSRVTDIGGS